MIEFLKGWILNITTLVVFIVLLEIIMPSGKTKKFINLISGLILVIALINPFLGLVNKGVDIKEFQVMGSNFLDKKQIESGCKVLNAKQMKQISEVYRNKLIGQIEDEAVRAQKNYTVKADVIINEDYSSDKFGEIKRVYLELKPAADDKKVKPVSRVDKVDIGKNTTVEKAKKPVDEVTSNKLQEKITKLFEIPKENIVIAFTE